MPNVFGVLARVSYFCKMGMTKAAVLPDPVLAMPTTSSPCKIRGIVLRCMGVGSLNLQTEVMLR